ncbi:MAG TPA: hypothetical protein VMU97_01940 [Candidatus Dormibacteraeota bacterium]|nr:hypothetical protein [Candidatus Dormibacteraeota bacterium]
MKSINKIVHDQHTYIESVGKHDRETVRAALADKGADTILRMCFGMTGNPMPVRALGYFASALSVQERYFPEAELQFVYPFRAAHIANGIDFMAAIQHLKTADTEAKRIFARRFRTDPSAGGQVKSFTDGELVSEDLENAVEDILKSEPDLQKVFTVSAKSRDGNHANYVAAHVLMHDTNPLLQPFDPLSFEDFADDDRNRVISIGAQSERPFYLARMACRRANLLPADMQVVTGQLFTKHVIPPYLTCREGEPLLQENCINTALDIPAFHPVASIERDLAFLRSGLAAEEVHWEARPQSTLVPEADRLQAVLGEMSVYYV